MREVLKRLLGPAGPEIDCEGCFRLLDRYVEAGLRGEDADAVVPGMRSHLDGCPACADDYASLRELAALEEDRARREQR